MFPLYTPWEHQKTFGFVVFSGGTKWDHWPELVKNKLLLSCTSEVQAFFAWMKSMDNETFIFFQVSHNFKHSNRMFLFF